MCVDGLTDGWTALGIVKEITTREIPEGQPEIPNLDYIARVANRKRQQMRPENSKDMNFVVRQFVMHIIFT